MMDLTNHTSSIEVLMETILMKTSKGQTRFLRGSCAPGTRRGSFAGVNKTERVVKESRFALEAKSEREMEKEVEVEMESERECEKDQGSLTYEEIKARASELDRSNLEVIFNWFFQTFFKLFLYYHSSYFILL
jgi:hypothetical protein